MKALSWMSVAALGAVLLISFFNPAGAQGQDAADRAMAAIRPEAIRADMRFLSDDLLDGRRTGTRGYELAAKFVASQFEALGLQPAGDRRTYFQSVPLRASHVDPAKTMLTWTVGGQQQSLAFPKDFLAAADPGRPEAAVEAPVVFVGFGISAPELHYDDYQGIDATGKIVALIYGAPPRFESSLRAFYSSGATKRAIAVAHGAVGYITLNDPLLEHLYSYQHRLQSLASPEMSWIDKQGRPSDYFPQLKAVALLNLEESRKFLDASGHSSEQVFAAAREGSLTSFETPIRVRIEVATKSQDVRSPNVLAVLPGSDRALRDQYVVFTAHLDHLGIAAPVHGDKIYNGALDNGSGSADLLEIARAMSGLNPRPRRSILFAAVTGEEEGLLGADYFAHYPTVAKSAIVADVNMDEDLMLWPLEDVVVYGAEHSSLGAVAREAAGRLDLTVSPDPQPEQVVFIRSDQYAFVKQGIPSIFPNAGVKSKDPRIRPKKIEEEWESTIYHSPQDDMNQPFDFQAGVTFARFNFLCGYLVAQQAARPVWNPGDFFGEHYASKGMR